MENKKYYHELSSDEIKNIVVIKYVNDQLSKEYNRPDWCKAKDALNIITGCFSLLDLGKKGLRKRISIGYCCNCMSFNKEYNGI